MKKLLYIFICVLPLASCVSKKNANKVAEERDSLVTALADRDSTLYDIFESLNAITENLNAIKTREKVISSTVAGGELKKEATVQINEDIEAIDQLLLNNRDRIARLESNLAQLRNANVKIASLEKLVQEMTTQIESKDGEIVELKENLRKLDMEVGDLKKQVSTLNTDLQASQQGRAALEDELRSKSDLLSTAYYIVGSQKELTERDIIYKSGFIGRTLKINEARSLDNFTQVDVRDFEEVIIGRKNITVVSLHPADSYELVMNDRGVISSLVITDKEKFWEYSKVMVISYK